MSTNKGIIINGGNFHGNVVSIETMNNYHNEQDASNKENSQKHKYNVALSYAGEDRSYVEIIAKELKSRNIKVFYDEFEETLLWGKDLFVYLDEIFKERAAFCVMFISEMYTKKAWCNLELSSAMHRQYRDVEYILPVCLDQTSVPGITDRYGYLQAKEYSPVQLAEVIINKLRLG